MPRKPLNLLKALVAAGGDEVPSDRLADWLWENDDADGARKSLEVTLMRLRRLLGRNDALIVSDERVSLNRDVCRVDADEFESLVEQIPIAVEAGPDTDRLLEAALTSCTGEFLPADTDLPWTVRRRLRIRGLHTRIVELRGRREEDAGRLDSALAVYERGLGIDPLIEAFYQGAMRCLLAQGRLAEGLNVFRRLRQTLSVVLGVEPSASSESLSRALRASGTRAADPDLRDSAPRLLVTLSAAGSSVQLFPCGLRMRGRSVGEGAGNFLLSRSRRRNFNLEGGRHGRQESVGRILALAIGIVPVASDALAGERACSGHAVLNNTKFHEVKAPRVTLTRRHGRVSRKG
ncbi:MAG: hypothetical protein IPK20_25695 [Betaproteobacteria bacterium]|nr:hypothetical protein [Betaproteobacteria bacterium]